MDIETVSERAKSREFGPKDVDALPDEYLEAATRMIQFHANSEIMGALLERDYIRQAPSIDRKLAFSAQVQDEIGHGQLLYRAAAELGVKTRDEMLDELAGGEGKFLNCFHHPIETWYDVPMIMFFVDGAAMTRQATIKRTSWEPYAHAMDKICFEEGFHIKHGESILGKLMTGSKQDRKQTQKSFEKWWPRILQFFGPTDDDSTHTDFNMKVGLKTATNDELRQRFLNSYVPKARDYGLKLPDTPEVWKDEDGTWHVNEDDLDWNEFWTISKNEHPRGVAQIDKRQKAQEAVEWIRKL